MKPCVEFNQTTSGLFVSCQMQFIRLNCLFMKFLASIETADVVAMVVTFVTASNLIQFFSLGVLIFMGATRSSIDLLICNRSSNTFAKYTTICAISTANTRNRRSICCVFLAAYQIERQIIVKTNSQQ